MSAMQRYRFLKKRRNHKPTQPKRMAAQSPTSGIAAITIPRRTPQPKDVQIEILYCGVCHTDMHFAHNDFANSIPTLIHACPATRSSDAW